MFQSMEPGDRTLAARRSADRAEQERREAQWASLQVLMARLGGREEVSAQ